MNPGSHSASTSAAGARGAGNREHVPALLRLPISSSSTLTPWPRAKPSAALVGAPVSSKATRADGPFISRTGSS